MKLCGIQLILETIQYQTKTKDNTVTNLYRRLYNISKLYTKLYGIQLTYTWNYMVAKYTEQFIVYCSHQYGSDNLPVMASMTVDTWHRRRLLRTGSEAVEQRWQTVERPPITRSTSNELTRPNKSNWPRYRIDWTNICNPFPPSPPLPSPVGIASP